MKTLFGLSLVVCLSACGGSDNPELATTGLANGAGAPAPTAEATAGHAAPPTAAGNVAACVSLASCCEQLSDARDRASCGDSAASANATTCAKAAGTYCPSSEAAPSTPPSVCMTLSSCCDAMTTVSDQVACDKMVDTGNAISCQDGANIFCPGSGTSAPAGVDACTVLSRCCLESDEADAAAADKAAGKTPGCAQIALGGDVSACAQAATDYCNN